ncbi:MAG TPA: hypothetical protein VKM93_03040 [Terriglobia bacterium]|nr:hypothetical protein [Terriglobia bacterium]
MKWEIRTELLVALGIIIIGGGLVGGEYFLVKWYPVHKQHVAEQTLKLLPYRNDGLGVELQVASGFYSKIEAFAGGVKIYRPEFWSLEPSLTITSQPNPDQATEFTPQVLAVWQTDGVTHSLPRYRFDHLQINGRDAVLISQYRLHSMLLTARVISPDRIIEADCTPGSEDEDLYMQACNETVMTLKVEGPAPPVKPPPPGGVEEITPPQIIPKR